MGYKKAIYLLVPLVFFTLDLRSQSAWTQKANFGGGVRANNVGFSIGHYGFVGCGVNCSNTNEYDFWKYDAYTNTWAQIANYPGLGNYGCTAFSLEGKGYVGLGWGGIAETDLWRYDTVSNAWKQMASFPGKGRYDCTAFVIGHKAYIVGGCTGGPPYLSDVWVYDAHQNNWKQLNNYPDGDIEGSIAFSIGNHGYEGNGYRNPTCSQNMYEYDTSSDTWALIAPIPAPYGVGGTLSTWTIGSGGYVCEGGTCTSPGLRNGWMYDTVTKSWCEFSDIGGYGIARGFGAVFTINNHGYFCTGDDTNLNCLADLWEYTPSTKINVTDTVGSCAGDSVYFSNSTSYIASGWSWSFPGGSPAKSNLQNPIAYYPTSGTYRATLILSTCGGNDTVSRTITVTAGTLANIKIKGNSSICVGTPDTLTASGGNSYLWSNGATTSTIIINPYADTIYSILIKKGPCTKDTAIYVTVSKLTPTITSPFTVCSGDTITLNASGGGTYKWNTGSSTSGISIVASSTTTYSVIITNGACIKDTSVTVTVNPSPVANITGKNQVCKGDSIVLTATGGGTYMWSTNQTSDSIAITPSLTSTYTVIVSNSFGCKANAVFEVSVALPIDSITGPSLLCFGDSILLSAIGGDDYHWSTGATTSSIEVTTTRNSVYYVSNICNDTARKNIFIDNNALALYACCDTTITLPGIAVVLDASGTITYRWLPSTGVSCDSCPNPTVTPTITTTYTVIGTDSAGCRTARTITVDVSDCLGISIPNVFTPNGDGINDKLYIYAQSASEYSIAIYDRWGKQMYQSTNPNVYWDGKNQNDHDLVSAGVYYYIVKYSCNNKSYNKDGYVQVIR